MVFHVRHSRWILHQAPERRKNAVCATPEAGRKPTIHLEDAIVESQEEYRGGYRVLRLLSPRIGPEVQPGQFVHLKVPQLREALLRRPFSVYKADKRTVTLLYKDIGQGTHGMTRLSPGDGVSRSGPLGRPFPCHADGSYPVLVAGGYGMAALYLVARNQTVPGIAFFGGATEQDILCVDEFENMGWRVVVTTVDGSLGTRGMVTDALDPWLAGGKGDRKPEFFSCGPNAMLKAVASRSLVNGWKAWVSMDRNMGCGGGACLTCVQKVRAANEPGWTWARVCKEGPVFDAGDVLWDGVD